MRHDIEDFIMVRVVLPSLAVGIACLVLFGIGAGIEYAFFDRPSQAAVIACRAKGWDGARADFSRTVICVPRYNGADSLHVTGVR